MIRYKIDISQKECDALIEMQLKHSVSRGIQNFFRIVLVILAIALLYCTFFLRQTTESKLAIGTPSTNQQIHTDRPPLNCRD